MTDRPGAGLYRTTPKLNAGGMVDGWHAEPVSVGDDPNATLAEVLDLLRLDIEICDRCKGWTTVWVKAKTSTGRRRDLCPDCLDLGSGPLGVQVVKRT